uniref:Uncharacterized protein n=1 Tax=Cucumis melo TaxID=3656 RepID=A0A9I9EFA3_CUCME
MNLVNTQLQLIACSIFDHFDEIKGKIVNNRKVLTSTSVVRIPFATEISTFYQPPAKCHPSTRGEKLRFKEKIYSSWIPRARPLSFHVPTIYQGVRQVIKRTTAQALEPPGLKGLPQQKQRLATIIRI